MHFKIKRLKLLNALSKATRAVSVRSPLPVLTGIKFDLKSDQLILTGSDSDITIQTIIDQDDDLEIIKLIIFFQIIATLNDDANIRRPRHCAWLAEFDTHPRRVEAC